MAFTFTLNVKDALKGLEASQAALQAASVKAMNKAKDIALEEAVKRAPIDEGNLQHSLQAKTEIEPGKVEAVVFIPANSPAADYALHMHEGVYNLGPVSQQKQASQGEMVGRKYLERALAENEERLTRMIGEELKKAAG
jgi:hypothetical protein